MVLKILTVAGKSVEPNRHLCTKKSQCNVIDIVNVNHNHNVCCCLSLTLNVMVRVFSRRQNGQHYIYCLKSPKILFPILITWLHFPLLKCVLCHLLKENLWYLSYLDGKVVVVIYILSQLFLLSVCPFFPGKDINGCALCDTDMDLALIL